MKRITLTTTRPLECPACGTTLTEVTRFNTVMNSVIDVEVFNPRTGLTAPPGSAACNCEEAHP